jgi:signal transduction histidine kinase/DNA-binding response OmpR family regulator
MKILKDAEGGIWIMQAGGYLCKYDPQQDHFVDPQRTPSDFILKQENGLFCLLGEDHLLRFDPISLDTIRIAFEKPLPVMNGLRSLLDLGSFIMDKKGNYWFGQQDGGLYCLDPKSGKWMHYNYDPDNPDGLPDVHVMNLYCDSRGTIWVSTFSGLSRIVPDSTSDNGFSFDNSYVTEKHLGRTIRVIEDLHGNIYAGSFSGLHIFKADGTYEFYTRHNGLPENADIRIWALEVDSQSGEIYFGSEDLLILPHDFLYPAKTVPEIILTDMYIGGKRVPPGKDMPLKKSIFFVDRLDLKHKQNFLQFEFSALSSSHYKTNRYRYILEGIDMDTIEAGTKNFAEYTDLSPGKYRFWVTGASHNGPWNPEGRSIDILIQPPWYGSSTAKSGYLIGLLLLVLGFVRIRTTKLRKEKLLLAAQVEKRTAELRQKNEKIVEMERLKTRFFTDVSHEIRTPLSLISGPLDVLLKQEYGNQNTHKHLGVIKRNSQRLVHLINQLLDISRMDSGQMKLILEETDIMHHLKVLANEYQSLAERNHICFITDIQQSIGKVWNDGDKIEKALTNLLSNAFKFTPEFGTITFRAKILYESGKQEIPFLRIIVADTGIGIHEEEKEKVFDRFYRSEGQEHNNSSGTGIGLSLTREMVRLLKGDIRVKSLVGKGTVFITTLPLGFHHLAENEYILKKEEASGGRTDISIPERKELHTRRTYKRADISVLVVEDNEEVRSFIKEVLEPEYLILEAGDGLQGYELAVSNLPDLIISDIMMPGMDGNVLCEKLKNDERTCHIPIIMLTARATTHDKIEGLECGADDYIFKPFRMEEVRARIINLLEQRERLRSKYSEYIGIDWSNMTVSTLDEQFLKKITETVTENLHDFSFNVGVLQDRMAMSESTLYKKLKALTGDSPSQLIRIMRLKYAASLLQKNDLSITEILMSAGFSNPSYFSRCFRAYFGMTPKAYQKSVSHSV